MSKTKAFIEGGISDDLVENIGDFSDEVLDLMCCILCSGIVKNPVECTKCETLYCQTCWDQLQISGQGCTMRCKAPVQKANKFIFELLQKLRLKCPICGAGGLSYENHSLHTENCVIAKKYGTYEELIKISNDLDKEIAHLKNKIADAKSGKTEEGPLYKYSQDELRKLLITSKLDVSSKMALYQSAVSGNLNEFKSYINKGFPLLEEVSAKDYYWTPLHYAMHYGKMDIAFFILDKLKEQGKYKMAMDLESNDKRTPVLCLLKSNALSLSDKREYFTRLVQKYKLNCSEHVKKEIKNRNLEEIYNQYQNDK